VIKIVMKFLGVYFLAKRYIPQAECTRLS